MKRTRTLKLPTSYELTLSPRGDRIAAIGRNVVIADTLLLKRIASCHPLSHPSYACFNSDGSLLAVKNTAGRIVFIDPASGETVFDFNNKRDGEGSNAIFSVDDQFLVDASWKGQIFVRHAITGQIDRQFAYEDEMITEVSRSVDGLKWAFRHQPKFNGETRNAPYVSLWHWPFVSAEIIQLDLDIANAASLSPQGDVLAVAGSLGSTSSLKLLDRSGRILRSLTIDSCKELRWSPCGTLLGRIGREEIVVHSSTDLLPIKSYPMQYPSSVCFAPGLSFIGLGSWEAGIVQPLEL